MTYLLRACLSVLFPGHSTCLILWLMSANTHENNEVEGLMLDSMREMMEQRTQNRRNLEESSL